jgi:hypothetical protein
MPFARKDFDDLRRHMVLYTREVGATSATVDVITVDGQRLCVLKALDVTENTVTFLVSDEQAGIALEDKDRHKTAVLLPHDAIRSVVFSPIRAKDARAAFTA